MKSSDKQNLLLGIAAVLILGVVAFVSLRVTDDSSRDSSDKRAQLQTLSPAMFTGKTRDAYQAAKDVPEVLEQMPCYCGCMQNSGHKNNLFCFMDQHAVG